MAKANTTGVTLTVGSTARNGVCGSVTNIFNGTGGIAIAVGNITQTGCVVRNTSSTTPYGATWLYTYPYTYDANNTATDTISDTTTALADVPTWFPIIITIAVMVTLILLTVLIIVAIRSSGLLAGGQ